MKKNRLLKKYPPVLLLALGVIFIFILISVLLLRFFPFTQLDDFLRRPYSARVYDRNGQLLHIMPLADGQRREYTALEDMGEELPQIFIAAEDKRFYSHWGVDIISAFRAVIQNMQSRRRVSGASTITMQLARIIAPNAKNTLWTKIMQVIDALRLELRFSKNEILELYLNSLPFGFQSEGVTTAARTFFACNISSLSPAQLFCLAVIPRRPSSYNPLTQSQACVEAAKLLYSTQDESRHLFNIDNEQWQEASLSAQRYIYPNEVPHFIRYLKQELLAQKEVYLSIDLEIQHYVEYLIGSSVNRYAEQRLTNGSAIVIDNKTGEILAWVGSADYYNSDNSGQIDGVLALNQPGSSMKPFLYALALEKGFKPSDIIADIPVDFGNEHIYIPGNFNNRFNGPVRLRVALASSLNIPAVSLLYRLGVQNYVDTLIQLGFDSIIPVRNEVGLGLALGNAAVSLAEMAHAYTVFPNDGILIPLQWQKTDMQSSVSGEKKIYERDTARLLCSFLSDASARVLAFGEGSSFTLPFPALFKTGTANQFQSIAALGATPLYTAAVWIGNFSGETIIGKTGSSLPAEIVRDTLLALQKTQYISFKKPEDYTQMAVCSLSGMLPSDACTAVVSEYIRTDADAQICTWHCIKNGSLTIEYPSEYQRWFFSTERRGLVDYYSSPLTIITPRERFIFLSDEAAGNYNQIPVEVIGGSSDTLSVTYDNAHFTVQRPFRFYLPMKKGNHTLRVHCSGEQESVEFSVE